jgi:hypothetical protein
LCFSPEASFIAAAAITTVGAVSLHKATDNPTKILACIPLFFGIQQLTEGFVWLSLLYEQFAFLKGVSAAGFIVFAWIIWPTWIPLSMWKIEKNSSRKTILKVFLFFGIVISFILAYALIFRNVRPEILDCSIIYNFEVSKQIHQTFGVLYLIVTVVPTLLSKVSKAWLLGAMNVIAYAGTKLFISDRILSIWCFFAAIASVIVLWIIVDYNKARKLEH